MIDMRDASPRQREGAARILVEALAHVPSAWKTSDEATAEVETFLDDPERQAWLACDDDGGVLGWIGRIVAYSHAWELHPLVVDPKLQRRGVGTALVEELEAAAMKAGVLTITLGSDDDFGGTSLYGRDLGSDPLSELARIEVAGGHPFTFYKRLGYVLCGIVPDANGVGRPDILMAKRMRRT